MRVYAYVYVTANWVCWNSSAASTRIWGQSLCLLETRIIHFHAATKLHYFIARSRLSPRTPYFSVHIIYNCRYHFTSYSLMNAVPSHLCLTLFDWRIKHPTFLSYRHFIPTRTDLYCECPVQISAPPLRHCCQLLCHQITPQKFSSIFLPIHCSLSCHRSAPFTEFQTAWLKQHKHKHTVFCSPAH